MRSVLLAALLLCLTSCSYFQKDKTPQERYYELNTAVTAAGKAVTPLVVSCVQQPADNPCKALLPKVNQTARDAKKTFDQLDQTFIKGDSQYYDFSLTVAENALKDLNDLIPIFKAAIGG